MILWCVYEWCVGEGVVPKPAIWLIQYKGDLTNHMGSFLILGIRILLLLLYCFLCPKSWKQPFNKYSNSGCWLPLRPTSCMEEILSFFSEFCVSRKVQKEERNKSEVTTPSPFILELFLNLFILLLFQHNCFYIYNMAL